MDRSNFYASYPRALSLTCCKFCWLFGLWVLQVDDGQAKEGLISVGSTQSEEPDPLDPEIIQRLDNKFSYRNIPDHYYTDEDGDEVR